MSYLSEVMYYAQKLESSCHEFQTRDSMTDTLAIEQSYDKVMHYINLEREVSGDSAMESLYNSLPEYIIEAIDYAEFITTSIDEDDLIEL